MLLVIPLKILNKIHCPPKVTKHLSDALDCALSVEYLGSWLRNCGKLIRIKLLYEATHYIAQIFLNFRAIDYTFYISSLKQLNTKF